MGKRKLSLTLIIAGGVLLTALLIYLAQSIVDLRDFDQTAESFLTQVETSLYEKEEMAQNLSGYIRSTNQSLLWQIAYLLDEQDYAGMTEEQRDAADREYQEKAENAELELLLAMDREGRIWQSSESSLRNKNIVEAGLLSDGQLQELLADAQLDNEYVPGFDQEKANSPDRGLFAGEGEERYDCHITPLYNTEKNTDYYLVSFTELLITEEAYSLLTDISLYFSPIVSYDQMQAVGIETDSGEIRFVSDGLEQYQGCNVSELGISSEELAAYQDGTAHSHRLNGQRSRVYVCSYSLDTIGSYTILVWQDSPLLDMLLQIAWPSAVVLAMLLFTAFAGSVLKGCGKAVMIRKMRVLVLLSILSVAGITAYIRAMTDISEAMEQSIVNGETFDDAHSRSSELEETIESFFYSRKTSVLKNAAEYLERYYGKYSAGSAPENFHVHAKRTENGDQEKLTDSWGNELLSEENCYLLQELAKQTGCDTLYLINSGGKTIAVNNENWWYDLDYIKDQGGEMIYDVIDRKMPNYTLTMLMDDGSSYSMLAVPICYYTRLDENGDTVYTGKEEYLAEQEAGGNSIRREEGVLVAEIEADADESFFVDIGHFTASMLDSMSASQNTELAVVTGSTENWFSYQAANFPEIPVSDLKLREEDFINDNYRFIRTDAGKRFVAAAPINSVGDSCLVTLFRYDEMFTGFWFLILAAVIGVLIPLLILKSIFTGNEEADGEKENVQGLMPITGKQVLNSARKKITDMKKSERSMAALNVIPVLLLAAALFLALGTAGSHRSTYLSFAYTLSLRWDRMLSVFSVSYTVFLLIAVIVSVKLIRTLLSLITATLSAQSATMIFLVLSVLQYGAVIAVFFYSLTLFGVEMGTVVTSGVVLSAVIGLGANSLISDILAGVMIILEREFVVGDIVTIDGFTGIVREISLRTTKVQDSNMNIKTFNNSRISGVLNLSNQDSKCFVTVDIPQNVSVDRIEQLISGDLVKAMEENRMVLEGPWFSGIVGMGNGSYKVSIGVRCLQKNQWKVQKDLYGKLIRVLTENGIKA